MELAKSATRPIVIADTQDNPGAGGDSDTTGMLRALVRNRASRAALGVIYDPQSATDAHEAGVGATVTFSLGGKSGIPGDAPYQESFVVEKLSDGKFVAPERSARILAGEEKSATGDADFSFEAWARTAAIDVRR